MKINTSIICLALVIIIALCVCLILSFIDMIPIDSLYAMTAEVIDVNEKRNLLTFETKNNDILQINNVEDWCEGDKAILIFDDRNDKIIRAIYNGR